MSHSIETKTLYKRKDRWVMKTRVKLSKITRLSLEKKGRKDAKRKVICFDNCDNGFLSTPFVREEISVCLSNIHREQEKMLHKNIRYLRSNDIRSSKKAQYQSKLDGLKREWIVKENYAENLEQNKNTLEKTGPNEVSLPGEDQLPNKDNTIKEFRKIEWQAPIEVEKAKIKKYKDRLNKWLTRQSSRIRFLETKINKIESRENRKRIREGLRNEIFIERCKQYYSLAIIRISAYWTGVLSKYENSDELFAKVDTQIVFDELFEEIESFEQFKKE